jgi:type II restriction/modification system DNA methylase subunit YeeA
MQTTKKPRSSSSLRDYRVLDPACGSGNFLFMALKALKDIEHQSHLDAQKLGLAREQDLVTGPHNVLGIELNDYAAELARITVWIGELQWRLAHGYAFKVDPVLDPLDQIDCRDALVMQDPTTGAWTEAAWPQASVVIGNPPFLGGSKKRRELGGDYFEVLDTVFSGRVPGGADLVCYWFDKARVAIETGGLGAAGLVATQSIRSGSNRVVLEAIRNKTRIFDAWSDEAWVNAGAAVRVSIISFGWGECCFLNGERVDCITAELGDSLAMDMTLAKPLAENAGVSFEGTKKYGDFDIPGELARAWLVSPNPHGRPNSEVVKPWRNGQHLTGRAKDEWIVDFGTAMSEADASLYELPFSYIARTKPARKLWWLHERPRVTLRAALAHLPRFIATVRVSKHRFFVFLDATVLPDTRLNAIARADDMTFGLLSSRLHEVWSLANASMHGVGNDPTYNAKSCFETFPFPACLTLEDTANQETETLPGGETVPSGITPSSMRLAAERIARAAKRLDDLRRNWLNPPEWTQTVPEVIPLGLTTSPYPDRILPRANLSEADAKALQKRTLTHLYNQRPAWLDGLQRELDATVAAAYGWVDYTPEMPDADILTRLLALNLERTAA